MRFISKKNPFEIFSYRLKHT